MLDPFRRPLRRGSGSKEGACSSENVFCFAEGFHNLRLEYHRTASSKGCSSKLQLHQLRFFVPVSAYAVGASTKSLLTNGSHSGAGQQSPGCLRIPLERQGGNCGTRAGGAYSKEGICDAGTTWRARRKVPPLFTIHSSANCWLQPAVHTKLVAIEENAIYIESGIVLFIIIVLRLIFVVASR